MGSGAWAAVGRQLRLYLWKNGLQKSRNPGQLLCELCTPIVMVSLFALLYTKVNIDTIPATTFECDMTSISNSECPHSCFTPFLLQPSRQQLLLPLAVRVTRAVSLMRTAPACVRATSCSQVRLCVPAAAAQHDGTAVRSSWASACSL